MIKRVFGSLRGKVLLVIIGALAPLIVLIIAFNMYVLSEYNEKLIDSNSNMLAFKVKDIEYSMTKMEGSMLNIVANEPDFRMFAFGKKDEYKDYMELYEVMKNLDSEMYINKDWWASAIASPKKGVYRFAANKANTNNVSAATILDYIRQQSDAGNISLGRNWIIHTIEDEYYLWRTLKQSDTCLIGMINISELLKELNKDVGDGSRFILFDNSNIYQIDSFVPADISLLDAQSILALDGGNYLFVEEKLNNSDLHIAYISPKIRMLQSIHSTQFLLVIISILLFFIVPVSFYILNRIFLKPLNRLEKTMEKMGTDRSVVDVPGNESEEFKKVYQTLNEMLVSISGLQNELYERQLEMNQTQLQYYQLQIRPHFYLNCLKSIYGMIQLGNNKNAENAIVLLSKHLRYILSENGESIPVTRELEFIRNYLELQRVGMEKRIQYEIECDEEMEYFDIPSISLLSVVENSVKHGYTADKVLEIKVKIDVLESEDGKIAHFIISDNGKGYNEEILERLNMSGGESAPDEKAEWHIGLNNMIQRFKLQYGDNVYFVFGNYNGPETEIFIRNEVKVGEGSIIG